MVFLLSACISHRPRTLQFNRQQEALPHLVVMIAVFVRQLWLLVVERRAVRRAVAFVFGRHFEPGGHGWGGAILAATTTTARPARGALRCVVVCELVRSLLRTNSTSQLGLKMGRVRGHTLISTSRTDSHTAPGQSRTIGYLLDRTLSDQPATSQAGNRLDPYQRKTTTEPEEYLYQQSIKIQFLVQE